MRDSNNHKLALCPFCGGEGELKGSRDIFWVGCYDIDCGGQTFTKETEKEAIEAWNRRADFSKKVKEWWNGGLENMLKDEQNDSYLDSRDSTLIKSGRISMLRGLIEINKQIKEWWNGGLENMLKDEQNDSDLDSHEDELIKIGRISMLIELIEINK